ncbi:MAG: molybdopterin-dependent oxidoreductase [Planctomycetes bacterium]|nr:molybdopterin-dependent oxidoreductase [Planctomycetota bacterium]
MSEARTPPAAPDPAARPVSGPPESLIGQRLPRPDARAKVTGAAIYTDDIQLPGMLYGAMLRSPVAHALIKRIDASKARALPGVKCVITGQDVPAIRYGNWRLVPELQDETVLATDKVRFIGDEVAAVAAVDKDTAEAALALIEVEYQELPAVFGVDEALADGAPAVHDEHPDNLSLRRDIDYGDLEQAFAAADYVREDTFTTHAVSHAYMEPCSALARADSDGRITLWTSTQTPYYVQCLLARTMELRENDVRVIKPAVGGGFGGKMELRPWDFCAAWMARETGRPVKFTLSREEELATGRRRHPVKITSKIAFRQDGTILGKEVTAKLDGGGYNGMGPTATFLIGNFGAMLYKVPAYRYRGIYVYTNNPPAGAMRGFGAPQALFAGEMQMNKAAEELGIDPIELRLKNAMEPGDAIPGVATIGSCGFRECLEKVRELSGWDARMAAKLPGEGLGIACYSFISGGVFNWFNTRYPFSSAEVKVFDDGTAQLTTLAADIGQGSDLILCQILAEELGLKIEDIRLVTGDTAACPQSDLGTWGSRVTLMAGNAVRDAARQVKERLAEMVSLKFDLNVIHEIACGGGHVYSKSKPSRRIPLGEAVAMAQRANRGRPLKASGYYTPRDVGLVSPAFSFGAQVADVRVDLETGLPEVQRMFTVHDCGTELNPMAVEGQLEGSIQMSLGYALSEELLMDRGRTLNATLLDYKLPVAEDMPPSVSETVETYEPEGPFGAKEAGEGLACPTAPAIAHAVHQATGYFCRELPITPVKILRHLGREI